MKIIAGDLKAKQIVNLSNVTHPMSEKIRGGLFNILGDINELSFLDCYAGTGAISFEALSRGAKSAVLIESDKKSQDSILNNIKTLKLLDKAKLIRSTVGSYINNSHNQKYDIIVCDPPFDEPIDTETFLKLEPLINKDGLLILSLPLNDINFHFKNIKQIKEKKYGGARLVFFR